MPKEYSVLGPDIGFSSWHPASSQTTSSSSYTDGSCYVLHCKSHLEQWGGQPGMRCQVQAFTFYLNPTFYVYLTFTFYVCPTFTFYLQVHVWRRTWGCSRWRWCSTACWARWQLWPSSSSSMIIVKVTMMMAEVAILNHFHHSGGSLLGEARRKGLERGLIGEECDSFSCSPPSHYRTPRWSSPSSPSPSTSSSLPSPSLCTGWQLPTDPAQITWSSRSGTSSRKSLLTSLVEQLSESDNYRSNISGQ